MEPIRVYSMCFEDGGVECHLEDLAEEPLPYYEEAMRSLRELGEGDKRSLHEDL